MRVWIVTVTDISIQRERSRRSHFRMGTEEEGRNMGRGLGPGARGRGGGGGGGSETKERLVCVTGGTGYIASNLIRRLLQLGYSVRATVRNPDDKQKAAFLWKLEGAKERLSIVGADLLQEGSFDTAMEGVEGVFHTAGPVFPEDPKGDPQVTMIDPTVKGTLNVMRSCTKSSTLRRIVMTSSCSAVRYGYNRRANDPPLDELSWSDADYCRDHKMWYALAKTQAEQAAWKFSEEHNLNLVVVNPAYIIGPFLGALPTSTVAFVLYLLQGKIEECPNQIIGFVHIDDVVATHVLVYEKSGATGRYICSSVVTHWQQILEMIRRKYPTVQLPTRCIEGSSQAIHHTLNTNKVQELGHKTFKSAESMFDDCIRDFIHKGLLPQLS